MSDDRKKSKWRFGVFFLYGGFVLFILTLVMYVSLQDIQLVEENYYQKDRAYQDRIERIERTSRLKEKVRVDFSPSNGNLRVKFPIEKGGVISGSIKLFRPSNARLDMEIPIKTDSVGFQEIDTGRMARGYWQLKADWQVDSVDYYSESPLFIN